MKKHVLRLSLLAALTASASFAETYNVKVPFDFVLGNKTTPAGQYVVDTAAGSNALVIRSADHKLSFAIIGSSLTSTQDAPNGKLGFHRYGHRSFLEQVWRAVAPVARSRKRMRSASSWKYPRNTHHNRSALSVRDSRQQVEPNRALLTAASHDIAMIGLDSYLRR